MTDKLKKQLQFLTEADKMKSILRQTMLADKIFKRMMPAKTALPELWEYVESVIIEGFDKGYIQPESAT